MLDVSNVNLEFYWKGPYAYGKGCSLSTIDIKMKECNYEILGEINRDLPFEEEQRLSLEISTKNGYFKDMRSSIGCSIDCMKSMAISARVFQTYEDPFKIIQRVDGTCHFEQRCRRVDCRIPIKMASEFHPAGIYQVKIVSQGNCLEARIQQKISEVMTQEIVETANI